MAFLALAMLGAIFLISAVVFGVLTAAVAVLDIGVLFAWFWYGQPLRRQRHGSSPKGSRGTSSPYSPKCVERAFSEVPHSPNPMRQGSYVERRRFETLRT
jgi:hypothetical protein